MASKSHFAGLLAAFSLLTLLAGCRKAPEPDARTDVERPATVYTVNYPLAYFAERMAPEGVEVHLPAPPGVDPAYWRPSVELIGRYQQAGVILLNGAGYARWAESASLPKSRSVVTSAGCRDTFLPSGERLRHQHGPEGEHAHADSAFTTWLDPTLARCQARKVRDALVSLSPPDEGAIDERAEALERELRALGHELSAATRDWGSRPLLASHPVYQYLADAYQLDVHSLHFEPGEPLGQDELRALDALRAEHPATLMLWEAAPRASTEAALRERGIRVVVYEPCAQAPPQGDFMSVMRANAARLACATGATPCE